MGVEVGLFGLAVYRGLDRYRIEVGNWIRRGRKYMINKHIYASLSLPSPRILESNTSTEHDIQEKPFTELSERDYIFGAETDSSAKTGSKSAIDQRLRHPYRHFNSCSQKHSP